MARRQGWSDEQLEAIDSIEGMKKAFEPSVQAALLYAELMTRDAHDVTDAFFERLQKHYDETQILELTSVIGLTNYFNRFTTALRIDLSGSNAPYDSGPSGSGR